MDHFLERLERHAKTITTTASATSTTTTTTITQTTTTVEALDSDGTASSVAKARAAKPHAWIADTADAVFYPVVTREFVPTKPSSAPLLHICSSWDVHPHGTVPRPLLYHERVFLACATNTLLRSLPLSTFAADVVMVGDYRDDLLCGAGAGALTVLIQVRPHTHSRPHVSYLSHVTH